MQSVLNLDLARSKKELAAALDDVKGDPRRYIPFLDEWVARSVIIPNDVENLNVTATYRAMDDCYELHVMAKDENEIKEIIQALSQLRERKEIQQF